MTVQDDINKALDDMAAEVFDSAGDRASEIVDEIDDIRLRINDLLMEYSRKDGKISPSRIKTLTDELDAIEGIIGTEFYDAVDEAIEEVSEKTEENLKGVLISVLGVALLFGGANKVPKSKDIVNDIFDFVFNEEVNGTKLSDKISSVAGFLRDEIQQAIRYGTHLGENVSQISQRVKDAFDKSAWRIKRVITTEIPKAFRKLILELGRRSGVIKAVKIIDNRGRHRYHERHECYRLAEQNPYGMGKGVYLPKDTYILDPHPQCSAYYHYILNEEALEGGDL